MFLKKIMEKMLLTLCTRETPKRVLFTNREDPDEMPHTLIAMVTNSFTTLINNI